MDHRAAASQGSHPPLYYSLPTTGNMQAESSRAALAASRLLRDVSKTQKRSYAISQAYVPTAASSRIVPLPPRAKPTLPTFFTGRPVYENALLELETLLESSRSKLRKEHIYPLPPSLAVPTPRAAWLSAQDLSGTMATHLKTAQYRRITTLLNELAVVREIARRAEQPEVLATIGEALEAYERRDIQAQGADVGQKDGRIDALGRSVSVGKRKESSARVWMIRTKSPAAAQALSSKDGNPSALPALLEAESQVAVTEVIVNSRPLHIHFPRVSDREAILRPLRLAGLIGHYNIFALTSGGGTSGQAGAVALGVARGLAVHRPELREVLDKGEHILNQLSMPKLTQLSDRRPAEAGSPHGRAEKDQLGQGKEAGGSACASRSATTFADPATCHSECLGQAVKGDYCPFYSAPYA